MDNLGEAWTPTAKQFRVNTLEIDNLATHANTGKHAFNLLTLVGLFCIDDA